MTALLSFGGIRADHCDVFAGGHRPRPMRFAFHHVLPQACGGKTVPDNLVQVCDNCHMAIHSLMWALANGISIPPHVGTTMQKHYAMTGYKAACVLGTQGKIPNEGSVLA